MSFIDCTTQSGVSPLSKSKARARYRLVYGVGLNDYPLPIHVNSKNIKSYVVWGSMLQRCYSVKFQQDRPTYASCSVAKEWLSFTAFESWFSSNYVEGCVLDKDLLVPGNLIYGPEACAFIPPALNSLLLDSRAARGEYPLGVCFHKATQKYVAEVGTGTGSKYLGVFTTPLEAHRAWQLAKAKIIESAETDDPRIRKALDLRALKLRTDHANGLVTTKL